MEEEIKIIYEILRHAKNNTESGDLNGMFLDLETLVSSMAYLITPALTLEQKYRQLLVSCMEAGDSHAKAEAKAKASDEYKKWKQLEAIMNLAQEQIMILKKFESKLEMEYRRPQK